ncbi:MAG: sugar transferase [Chitinophagaceae bacterium]
MGIWVYVVADFFTAALAWGLFSMLRRVYLHPSLNFLTAFHPEPYAFYVRWIGLSLGWVLLYFIIGTYQDIYQKSRLMESFLTFLSTGFGVIILFFVLIIRDATPHQDYYLHAFFSFWGLQWVCTLTGRILLLNQVKRRLVEGKIKINTLIIGANQTAIRLYQEISQHQVGLGIEVVGFIYPNQNGKNGLGAYLPNFGSISQLEQIIDLHQIQQVILAIEKSEQHQVEMIINRLSEKDVTVKIIPDMYDILSGSVRMSNVFGAVLIEIKSGLMPDWQQNIKRMMDTLGALIGLILLTPLMAYIALRVKFSSPGPIFYRQERIGYKGKAFQIVKFRSMVHPAETGDPRLSNLDDDRITRWGKKMRQWRLDELPQLWNILKGEMSFVGPRPERKYFIDQIQQCNAYYGHLLKVKPGLTSWGMVKYGYAENIEEMIERMQYDLIYLENISLALDFKIMTHTVLTILKKQGK